MDELQAKLLDLLNDNDLHFHGGEDGGNSLSHARILSTTGEEMRFALGLLQASGFAETSGGLSWAINDKGRQELARLLQTPEGRRWLERDQ